MTGAADAGGTGGPAARPASRFEIILCGAITSGRRCGKVISVVAIHNFMVDVEHVFCYNEFINTRRKKKNTCLKPV